MRCPVALLVGREVHAVPGAAQVVHEGEGLLDPVDAAPHVSEHLFDRGEDPELAQVPLEERHELAVAGEHRPLVLPGLVQELAGALAEIGLHGGVPTARQVLEDAVGVQQHVSDGSHED